MRPASAISTLGHAASTAAGPEGQDLRIAVFPAGASPTEILRAIEAGLQGPRPRQLDLDALEAAVRSFRKPKEGAAEEALTLTPRQRDVVELAAAGKSNKEIARHLGLAPGTVKVHLAGAFRALGVRNRAAAVAAAMSLPPRG